LAPGTDTTASPVLTVETVSPTPAPLNTALIGGIAGGVVGALFLAGLVAWFALKRSRRSAKAGAVPANHNGAELSANYGVLALSPAEPAKNYDAGRISTV
jgi:hypothetical protein